MCVMPECIPARIDVYLKGVPSPLDLVAQDSDSSSTSNTSKFAGHMTCLRNLYKFL